jgi:uracil-DNA glycosylase family 4
MHTDPAQLLRWYAAAGVDECIGERAVDRYAQPAKAAIRAAPATPAEPSSSAHLALAANSLDELKAAMLAYDGCALKRTCQSTVFADGNPEAKLMIIGEAPGADEDRLGLPFVGASGKLLDAMLAAIGLDRGSVYICNVVPWRPPGNRKPEPAEVELCLPFVTRQIELVDPALLLLLGGAPTAALLARTDSITRLRGHWIDYQSKRLSHPIPALPTFHPAYLLRTPAHKKEAWRDMLAVQQRLSSHQAS